jgi:hypothetical protein
MITRVTYRHHQGDELAAALATAYPGAEIVVQEYEEDEAAMDIRDFRCECARNQSCHTQCECECHPSNHQARIGSESLNQAALSKAIREQEIGRTYTYRRALAGSEAKLEITLDSKKTLSYRQGGKAGVWVTSEVTEFLRLAGHGWEHV